MYLALAEEESFVSNTGEGVAGACKNIVEKQNH